MQAAGGTSGGNFEAFFKQATGEPPYPYQSRLATAEPLPALLDIPTGLGKTAAVVVAWLWRRRFAEEVIRRETPRRLVYCLPMRVLVEQTRDNARAWLKNLGLDDQIAVHVLMGGEDAGEWDLHPECDAILIGTQDMLFSRALNRGYGMRRYRWPVHFGLLNNDCLWVMDETQLMGVGVETSGQLAALREKLGTHGKSQSLWMSATMGQAQLETVDHPQPPSGWRVLGLARDDLAMLAVQKRITALKCVRKLDLALSRDGEKSFPQELAAVILRPEHHQAGTLTLVVVNRVARAQQVYQQLLKQGRSDSNTALIHSRFREADREKQERILFDTGDRIVVATQAVEAGVDVSARTLVSELAPWPSLVQRFGRCNRHGEFNEGSVLWVNVLPADDKDGLALPYSQDDLKSARAALEKLTDAAPQRLKQISVPMPVIIRPVLRRKDLLDLFDTTPDLCGNDLDISRFVRDGEDTDVQVFWRDVAGETPPPDLLEPARGELVRVSIGRFRDFLKKKKPQVWRWNPLEEGWETVADARPGQTYLIERNSGGYSGQFGWTGDPADKPVVLQPGADTPDAINTDKRTFIGKWVELTDHLEHVTEQGRQLAAQLGLSADLAAALIMAARWHDVGKAHVCFRQMLLQRGTPPDAAKLWAKSETQRGRCQRKGFRHELASALAWLQLATETTADKNLVAYLIAAHHGRVRLSIRSLPNEKEPPEADRLFARGIWHGDELPAISLGNGETMPAVKLDLSFLQMGDGPRGESWLARMLRLRDDLATGPFRLAYWETLLRVADWRASELEKATP